MILDFDSNLTEICSSESNSQYFGIGLGNGFGAHTGNKPLPESMVTPFIDAYMWHKGGMS